MCVCVCGGEGLVGSIDLGMKYTSQIEDDMNCCTRVVGVCVCVCMCMYVCACVYEYIRRSRVKISNDPKHSHLKTRVKSYNLHFVRRKMPY